MTGQRGSSEVAEPRLSIVVAVHNMRREAPRTLYSLSAAFQRRVGPREYEVIVVENGSSQPLAPGLVESFGDNFRYFFLEDPPGHCQLGLGRGEIWRYRGSAGSDSGDTRHLPPDAEGAISQRPVVG